jgi:hypothetical protein
MLLSLWFQISIIRACRKLGKPDSRRINHEHPSPRLADCASVACRVAGQRNGSGLFLERRQRQDSLRGSSARRAPGRFAQTGRPTRRGCRGHRKANAEKQLTEREKQEKSKESATKSAEEQTVARQREENCRQAKSTLAALESGQIRFVMDAKGERVALDGAVREAELGKARNSVDSWCKPVPTK